MGIDNIHCIRNSLKSLMELLSNEISPAVSDPEFHSKLGATNWLHYIRLILYSSVKICRLLNDEGASVLVHCSDG